MANDLKAHKREDFGKGAARRFRREGQVPAVMYGNGDAPVHITVDAHELTLLLRRKVTSITLDLNGKSYSVSPRDIQIEPVRRYIEHVDLVIVTAAQAEAIAREAAAHSAAAEAAANAAAEAAAEKAAARAARQAAPAADESAETESESAE
jgi:large subunit ribosomal protein L25